MSDMSESVISYHTPAPSMTDAGSEGESRTHARWVCATVPRPWKLLQIILPDAFIATMERNDWRRHTSPSMPPLTRLIRGCACLRRCEVLDRSSGPHDHTALRTADRTIIAAS